MAHLADRITELESQLSRYPADRYPVQHATGQFHLGTLLHAAQRWEAAEAALASAVAGLDVAALPREHGVAANALGSLLRDTGRAPLAVELFRRAIAAFDAADADHDAGAAWHNLGLALHDTDDPDAAATAFTEALDRIDADRSPAAASAAARELGASLLTADRIKEAVPHLEQAVVLADRGRDAAALGAATNVLGLARLAAGQLDAAVEAFGRSAAALPRTVHPAGHGMALANLALAHQRAGDELRARLTARQALSTPAIDEPVRAQAAEVLAAVGEATGDLVRVLADEPAEHRAALVRAEVARWADLPPEDRTDELVAWIDGQLAAGHDGIPLAAALLDVYLEVEPDVLERLVAATVAAADRFDTDGRDRFKQQLARAVVRFPMPQWMRLRDRFTAHAGGEPGWG